ncbi:CLUMA_CG016712, isoform A [Clunio marinus]|uniref:CLUMA_CG016712, isoform A n=1 Tax=Clunio marinus TaxID=568069 RepID=A0A1J1IX30_9DIPT|nr:CLUMA_CG016712, isoform A [Clunio marinus]
MIQDQSKNLYEQVKLRVIGISIRKKIGRYLTFQHVDVVYEIYCPPRYSYILYSVEISIKSLPQALRAALLLS